MDKERVVKDTDADTNLLIEGLMNAVVALGSQIKVANDEVEIEALAKSGLKIHVAYAVVSEHRLRVNITLDNKPESSAPAGVLRH